MRIEDYQIAEIRERTDLVELVGRYVDLRRKGRDWKGLCPFHPEKTPSFNVNEVRKSWKCFGCGVGGDAISFVMEIEHKTFVDALTFLADMTGVDTTQGRREAQQRAREHRRTRDRELEADGKKRTDFARRIIDSSSPIQSGDPVDLYLRGRKLQPLASVWPGSLRRTVLRHPDDHRQYPVMLGIVTHPETGETLGVHRTFLTEQGQKAPVNAVKLSLGPIGGGVVRLGIDSEEIAIAEGIESALGAGMTLGLVPWAALFAGNMPKLTIPRSVRAVTICQDDDENAVGHTSAIKLRNKIKALQREQQRLIEVHLLLPPMGRADFADFG